MIPTSIDGTDITGATIDGTDVTEITVDGDVVFSAARTIVDDFETDLSAWTGSTNQYSLVSDSKVGNTALEANSEDFPIVTTTGKEGVPTTGDTHQVWLNTGDRSNASQQVIYGHVDNNNEYFIVLEWFDGGVSIRKRVNGVTTVLDSSSINIPSGWILLRMFHDSNGSFLHEFFDENLNILASLSGNDSSLITNGEFDSNAVAIENFRSTNDRWDHWVIL